MNKKAADGQRYPRASWASSRARATSPFWMWPKGRPDWQPASRTHPC